MYVILTSKPGQFRTEPGEDLRPVEVYDYLFYGSRKAQFSIAELVRDTRVTIVDEPECGIVNRVPSKFLEKFETVERARRELEHLTTFGGMDARLVRLDPVRVDAVAV